MIQGWGASAGTNGGRGNFSYFYTPSYNTPGYNSWAMKTVEYLPDNNETIVYTNHLGEVMLKVHRHVRRAAKNGAPTTGLTTWAA